MPPTRGTACDWPDRRLPSCSRTAFIDPAAQVSRRFEFIPCGGLVFLLYTMRRVDVLSTTHLASYPCRNRPMISSDEPEFQAARRTESQQGILAGNHEKRTHPAG